MCRKRMGQTDGCGRIVGRFVSKGEVGFLVWQAECAVSIVILADLLFAFFVLLLTFTVCGENLNPVGALHTSVQGGFPSCVRNLSSRSVHIKQEAGPLKTLLCWD